MDNFLIKKYPAFSENGFLRFWSSQLLSQTGGYIQNVALSAAITQITGSRLMLGLFLGVSYLPVFLLSYPAGRLTAKVPVKRMLIITEAALFILSAILFFVGQMQFWWYLVFGALWGTVRAFQTPLASSVPRIICGENTLSSGVAAVSLAMSLSRAIGPIVSGVLYTVWGFRAAFAANALSYIPSLILLFGVKAKRAVNPPSQSGNGMKLNVFLLVIVFTVSLVGTPYNIIFTGLTERAGLSRVWFSVFMGLIGVGAAVGAYIIGKKPRLYFAVSGIAVSAIISAFTDSLILICPAVMVWGLCDYLFFTSALTKIQSDNPPDAIARAMGIYTIITTGALPVGFAGLGYLSDTVGITVVLILSALTVAGVYTALFVKLRD